MFQWVFQVGKDLRSAVARHVGRISRAGGAKKLVAVFSCWHRVTKGCGGGAVLDAEFLADALQMPLYRAVFYMQEGGNFFARLGLTPGSRLQEAKEDRR